MKRIKQSISEYVHSTPDHSNLQGKSKKVRVTGSSKKIAGIKKKKFLPYSKFNVSDASTLFFPDLSTQNMVRVIGGKRNALRGNKNYFEFAGGSSNRGFELPRVKLQKMYEGNPREIVFGSS